METTRVRTGFRKTLLGLCLVTGIASQGFAKNPFIHSIYTADPSARVWDDGRIYVYASHDVDPNRGCDLMDRYHVFSSTDMVTWVDEGEILNSSQVPWGRAEGGFMWAPDCAYRNGTYYFYFPHPSGTDWGSSWKIGVATSSRPASDFVCQGYIEGMDALIDPCVFVDDDGQAYIYQGGGGICKAGRLKENMLELDGNLQQMQGLVDFHEAAWVHKRNGVYYLSYADNHADASGDNRMCYATGSGPLGPWTFRGIVMDPTDSYCAHGSIVEYKGQWYVFYHNSAISDNDWLRSICVDRLSYNDDGTIQLVTQTTTGVPAIDSASSPQPVVARYEAEDGVAGNGATASSDTAASGGKCVQNLHIAGSTLQFNNVDGGTGGRATVHIHYAADEFAKVNLTVNGTDHSFVNTPSTGGWSDYNGHSYLTVPLLPGKDNTIRLTGGSGGVNVDYLSITSFEPSVSIIRREDFQKPAGVAVFRTGPAEITYVIPEFMDLAGVSFSIHDARGRSVWQHSLRKGFHAGRNTMTFDADAIRSNGLYVLRTNVFTKDRPRQVCDLRIPVVR